MLFFFQHLVLFFLMGRLMTSFLPFISRSLDCLLPKPGLMSQSLCSGPIKSTSSITNIQINTPNVFELIRIEPKQGLNSGYLIKSLHSSLLYQLCHLAGFLLFLKDNIMNLEKIGFQQKSSYTFGSFFKLYRLQ